MKTAMINSVCYSVIPEKEFAKNNKLYELQNVAIEMEDGRIIPVANNPLEPGVMFTNHNLFGIDNDVPYDVLWVMDFPTDNQYGSITEIIEDMEKNRDLMQEEITTTDSDNIFKPIITGNESAEMKALKEAIIMKNIDINKYEKRFNGKLHNDKRAINNKDDISMKKIKSICDALDIKVTITMEDKEDATNPMGDVVEVVITSEESV